jgi:hypothetical protein
VKFVPSSVQRYLLDFLALFLGCLLCFLLRTGWNWSPLLAASALGVAVTYVPVPARFDRRGIQIAFCTGTFVGMSSLKIISSPQQVLVVSLLGTALGVLAGSHFKGIGGRMGFIAFLASSTWLLLRVFA